MQLFREWRTVTLQPVRLEDSDNDGLWTSMYLAGQAFPYAVTKEEEALENIRAIG